MKIYTITHDDGGCDCYNGHVIVANNTNEVISLAQKQSADEGEDVWDNTASINVQGEYTGEETEPFILLSDFHAG